MANEFKVKKGLIVQGSGSTVLDIQGSQGQLFSVTDSLVGSLFSVNDISGMPIMEVFSDDRVNLGTFNAEAIKVSGSTATVTGSLFGTSSYATQALSASWAPAPTNAFVQSGNSFGTTALLGTNDNNSLAFETSGSTRMFISSSGAVGIGTTSPTQKLMVSDGNIHINTPNNNEVGNGVRLNRPGATYAGFEIATNNTVDWSIGANNSGFGIYEDGLAATTRLIIKEGGNVGIGTNTPNAKLDVNGDAIITGSLTVTGRITAEEFHTEFVSSSIIYQSGSTKFGDSSDDVMSVTGSLRVNGSITGSLFGTASYATTALNVVNNGVTSVATNNGLTGGTITSTGTIGLTGQALALHNLATNGIVVRTGSGTVAGRTLTGTSNQITVTNGDGVSGNPTISLPATITGLTSVTSTTFVGALSGNASTATSASYATVAQSVLGTITNALTASNITPAINGNVNNRVLTADGDGTLTGEANLTFDGTLLYANSSFRQGGASSAAGAESHAEGNATNANGDYAHAEGDSSTAVGEASHAEGKGTFAVGNYSHAEGYQTSASAAYSHAEGESTISSGSYSHAEGNTTTAQGTYSHAEGKNTLTLGGSSHAEGFNTIASGDYSHAEGDSSTAVGEASHAEGYQTSASADYSHAEGFNTIASGSYSHAEGYNTLASGSYSHAEGDTTRAEGLGSHTEGVLTRASGQASHAEGIYTTASGDYSHAEGSNTVSSGISSHAAGYYTLASGNYQSVIGMYNQSSTNQGAFIIGNGTGTGARSNLLYASGSQVQITGSLVVSAGITGALTGNASTATTANATTAAITFNNGGAGATSGTTFNGSTARTISYNTIGAQPLLTNPVTGTGANNRVALWSGTTTQDSDANLTFDGTTFNVGGTLTATVKSFIIDHPTKEGKKLQYGVLEGPEHSVYVRGKLTNNNTITLPDHWTGLVHEDTITVNLTPIGKRQDLWVETVTDTSITVGSDNEINCFYTVFAERKDIEKLVTEFDK